MIDASDPGFRSGAKVGAFKGACQNLSNSDYHALDSYWSSTNLKYLFDKSPAHFHQYYLGKHRPEPKKPSEDMMLGSLVHTLTLTPNEYEKEFFIMPDLNFRTNEGKAEKQRLLTENAGKQAISREMLIEANQIKSAIMMKYGKLIEPAVKEASIFWTCKFSELNFRAKIDGIHDSYWLELKTMRSAKADDFSRQLHKLNYDLSLCHYRQAIQAMGIDNLPAIFIAAETDSVNGRDYEVQDYDVDIGCWETGHMKWMDAVTKLENGIKGDKWPGYFPEGMRPKINPPPWAMRPQMAGGRDD